jgi:hypothetical protein
LIPGDPITTKRPNPAAGDPDLLDRAGFKSRVLYTQDDDFLAEAARRQKLGISFSGIIYVHPLRLSIGSRIRDLEIIAKTGETEDLRYRVIVLPL